MQVTVMHRCLICATLDYWNLGIDKINEHRDSKKPGGMAHACEFETSLMLALDSQNVSMQKICDEISYPTIENFVWHDLFFKSSVHIPQKFSKLSKSGVIGQPTSASEEKGQTYMDEIVNRFVEFLKIFKKFDSTN